MNRRLAYLMSRISKTLNMEIVEINFSTYDFNNDLVVFIFIDSKIRISYDTRELLDLQDTEDIDYFVRVVKEAYVTEYINKILK